MAVSGMDQATARALKEKEARSDNRETHKSADNSDPSIEKTVR
jgi:hypothetical protein